MERILSEKDLLDAVNEYGILTFWDENGFSSWSLSGVNFMQLWNIREGVVNSGKVAYGKFLRKKSTFVSLDVFPALCALRRDGYDFDSLVDEGLANGRETLVMNAIEQAKAPTPSYALGKSLGIKGYDAIIASLHNKTYLATTFKKSTMGTALLSKPEDLFGYDLVRSAYSIPNAKNAELLASTKGMQMLSLPDKELSKALSPAI